MLPIIKILEVKDTYIYLKNILRWAEGNTEIDEAKQFPFEILIKELDTITANFKPIFNMHHDLIMNKIKNISGFDWSPNFPVIYVYPIPFFNSFSHPLFLRVCSIKKGKIIPRGNGLLLGTLIHELTHNNIPNISIDRKITEDLINYVVIITLDSIDEKFTKEYTDFQIEIKKDISLSLVPPEIKIEEMTISEYLNKK